MYTECLQSYKWTKHTRINHEEDEITWGFEMTLSESYVKCTDPRPLVYCGFVIENGMYWILQSEMETLFVASYHLLILIENVRSAYLDDNLKLQRGHIAAVIDAISCTS